MSRNSDFTDSWSMVSSDQYLQMSHLYFAHSCIVEIKQQNKLNCPLNTGLLERSTPEQHRLISPIFLFTKSRAACTLPPLHLRSYNTIHRRGKGHSTSYVPVKYVYALKVVSVLLYGSLNMLQNVAWRSILEKSVFKCFLLEEIHVVIIHPVSRRILE